MLKGNLLDILNKLGLTEYESKTLDTLFRLKEAKAPVISQNAQVPKTRVYDVLDSLIEKKLIVEIQGRPKKYRLIEPKKTLKQVAENKRKEIEKLEEEIEQIAEEHLLGKEKEVEEEKVMKVKNYDDFIKILSQELLEAKEHVNGFSDLNKGHSSIRDALKQLGDSNVSVRILHSSESDETRKYSEHSIDSKHLEHAMNAFVVDGKKLILALNDLKQEKPEYYFTIWHHPNLVKVMNNHFSECWEQAK